MNTFTDHDMRSQVRESLDGDADGFDINAIVEDLQRDHGTVDIDTIEHDAYWATVARHAR